MIYIREAVIIDILYTSSALHPLDRSLMGALSPCKIGPKASKLPKRWAILYPMFPELISGKIKTLAFPATADCGAFVLATVGENAASN